MSLNMDKGKDLITADKKKKQLMEICKKIKLILA